MANPAISRAQVHALAEACSDEGEAFQSTAARLVREQRRVSRFVEQNVAPMGPMAGQVALYMLTVCLRIVEQVGGRLNKVSGRELDAASARVNAAVEQLMPADDTFHERARAIEWRAQPHLLDEILWALYERDDKKEEEVDVDHEQSALIYILLWAAVEAVDAKWRAPADFDPDAFQAPEEAGEE